MVIISKNGVVYIDRKKRKNGGGGCIVIYPEGTETPQVLDSENAAYFARVTHNEEGLLYIEEDAFGNFMKMVFELYKEEENATTG